MSSPLTITLFRNGSLGKNPVLSICFGWDSGTDASLYDVCAIMEALAGKEDSEVEVLAASIIKVFPESGVAIHPSWYKGDEAELKKVKKTMSEASLPEGKSRNDGLLAISPTAIKEMESFACNAFYLEFGASYDICDFLDMTETSEFEPEELEDLDYPPKWMHDKIPWKTALAFSKRFSSNTDELWLCPWDEGFILQRCDY